MSVSLFIYLFICLFINVDMFNHSFNMTASNLLVSYFVRNENILINSFILFNLVQSISILLFPILFHRCTRFYYSLLYYTILYCTILYYTILYYTTLYYTILYYTILYYTTLYYTILYHTIQFTSLQFT